MYLALQRNVRSFTFRAAFPLRSRPISGVALSRRAATSLLPLPHTTTRQASLVLFSTAATVAVVTSSQNDTAYCSPASEAPKINMDGIETPAEEHDADPATSFPADLLFFDHYNGATIHLDKCNGEQEQELLSDPSVFETKLQASLQRWKQQGRKGIWLYCPVQHSAVVPIATRHGFEFHMVQRNSKMLVLSKWLPPATPSKLPHGPTHQVGVGCVVLCPWDSSQMLVVQEKTGPAAAYGLWKMPTGLSDPGEDINLAAERELFEETGLKASFQGIMVFRQAHSSRSGTRASSDLFFVCQMKLTSLPKQQHSDDNNNNTPPQATTEPIPDDELFQACPDEIAAIRWMSVQEYCDQERWQTSPVYLEMNSVILRASQQPLADNVRSMLIDRDTLPLGFQTSGSTTNTLYYKKSNL